MNARKSGYFLTDEIETVEDTHKFINDKHIIEMWEY